MGNAMAFEAVHIDSDWGITRRVVENRLRAMYFHMDTKPAREAQTSVSWLQVNLVAYLNTLALHSRDLRDVDQIRNVIPSVDELDLWSAESVERVCRRIGAPVPKHVPMRTMMRLLRREESVTTRPHDRFGMPISQPAERFNR